jgi:uncharacterized GH25 family protein
MNRSGFVFAALALLTAHTAFAHDVWIEPSSFRLVVGERVTAALRVGEGLAGEPMPRIPALIERFILKGSSREIPLIGRSGADPAGMTAIAEPGPQWIGYQSKAYPMTIDAQKFETYLKDEGLERIIAERARKGQSRAPGRERFHRCAKALLDVQPLNPTATVTDIPLGFTLELVPRKNPYVLKPGDVLPLSLTFRGKPIANVLVMAMRKGAPEKAVRARTDAHGRVSLRLDATGFWLVKAVYMKAAPPDAGVDWESWWASMTFDLQGTRAQ